jgi:hypothetical protein
MQQVISASNVPEVLAAGADAAAVVSAVVSAPEMEGAARASDGDPPLSRAEIRRPVRAEIGVRVVLDRDADLL